MKILQSPLLSSLVGLALYVATTAVLWKPVVPESNDAGEGVADIVAHAKSTMPSWEYQNPDADLMIEELKREREALDKREKDLNALAERLAAERMEINVVTQSVFQLQSQLDKNIARLSTEEAANIKKLAKTYAAMSPEGAAAILKELDDSTLVKILAALKDSESAPILEIIGKMGDADAKRVAVITERLRTYMVVPKETKKGGTP